MRIEDGSGTGRLAKVDSNGRLCVTLSGDDSNKFDELTRKVDDMHDTLAELMLLLLCDQKKEPEIKEKTEE